MSDHCYHCDTRERIIVPKQLSADDDVSSGRITEGKYLEICRITKKLYENLMVLCYCKDVPVEEEEVIVIVETVTTDNTIHLAGLPGDFLDKFLNEKVWYTERRYNNQGSIVINLVSESPFTHIYYDTNDGQFKSQLNWFDDIVGLW